MDQPWGAGALSRTLTSALLADAGTRGDCGSRDRPLKLIDTALAMVEESDERVVEAELHRLRGELLALDANLEGGIQEVARAIEIARQQFSVAFELRALVSMHALTHGATQAKARDEIERVLGAFEGGESTPDVAAARKLLMG
jgi:hypothetical protein